MRIEKRRRDSSIREEERLFIVTVSPHEVLMGVSDSEADVAGADGKKCRVQISACSRNLR